MTDNINHLRRSSKLPQLPSLERLENYYEKVRSLIFERRSLKFTGATPFISFSFDDFPRSAYLVGGAILKKYDIRGSYYASFGLMGSESLVGEIYSLTDLQELVNDGHELGCHTYDHTDSWKGKPDVFEESIIKNQQALKAIFPETPFKTMSYPKRHPHPRIKQIAGRYFKCCRGGGQNFNAITLDLNNLKSYFIDRKNRDDPAELKALIDTSTKANGWLIISTHDICNNPSPFGCEPKFFEEIVIHAVHSGATILSVYEVYLSIYNHGFQNSSGVYEGK